MSELIGILYPLNKFCSTTSCRQGVKANPVAFCWLDLFKRILFDLKHSSIVSLRDMRNQPMSVLYPLNNFCSTIGCTQDAVQKTFRFCWLGLFEYTPFNLKHSSMILLIAMKDQPTLVSHLLKNFCSTTSCTQGVKENPIAFCLSGLFKHTSFDLRHSSIILLIENSVLINVSTLPLNQILLS